MRKFGILCALAFVLLCYMSPAGAQEITVGGEIRTRANLMSPNGFDNDLVDDDWIVMRSEVNVMAELTDGVSGYIALHNYDVWGTSGGDDIDLYQAYIQVDDAFDYDGLTIKVGRQEIPLNREFILGVNDSGMNFPGGAPDAPDAVCVVYNAEPWVLKGVAAKMLERRHLETDADNDIYGLCGHYSGLEETTINPYWILRRNAEYNEDEEDKDMDETDALHTVGALVEGTGVPWGWDPFDYYLEAAAQFGEDGSNNDYKGWAVDSGAGWMFADAPWTPKVTGCFTVFSGDEDAADDESEAFNRVLSDAQYGEILDDVMLSNCYVAAVKTTACPADDLTLGADVFWYKAMEDTDGSHEEKLGYEVDLWAEMAYTEDLTIKAGWSHFFADDGVSDSGINTADNGTITLAKKLGGSTDEDDIDYLYLEGTLRF